MPSDTHLQVRLSTSLPLTDDVHPQVSRRETCKCVSAGLAVLERGDMIEDVSGSRVP